MDSGDVNRYLVGPYASNGVTAGDAAELIGHLPDASINIVVTSPPYWGQRASAGGIGTESDPRCYVASLVNIFERAYSKLTDDGILWLNMGDVYNTPLRWRVDDYTYSTLGADRKGLDVDNAAYQKPRPHREAYLDSRERWLSYGNLLGLPYRVVLALCDIGYLYRGEVIWRKVNPLPEGRPRRPHRQHEAVYLLAKRSEHSFRVKPPVGSVWDIASDSVDGLRHYSRFPVALPRRCIWAYGRAGPSVVVLDPFSGSGSTGLAALSLGCRYIGFEIDREQAAESNRRLAGRLPPMADGTTQPSLFDETSLPSVQHKA